MGYRVMARLFLLRAHQLQAQDDFNGASTS